MPILQTQGQLSDWHSGCVNKWLLQEIEPTGIAGMIEKWLTVSASELAAIFASAIIAYSAVLLYTRIIGLRSFSKMSAADFAMTIACGSILGATISAPSPTALAGI